MVFRNMQAANEGLIQIATANKFSIFDVFHERSFTRACNLLGLGQRNVFKRKFRKDLSSEEVWKVIVFFCRVVELTIEQENGLNVPERNLRYDAGHKEQESDLTHSNGRDSSHKSNGRKASRSERLPSERNQTGERNQRNGRSERGERNATGNRFGTKPRRRKLSTERHPGPLYGALDLGTNNCRLLIATPTRGGFEVVDAFSRIVRLGEGASANKRLSDDAMGRTISALRVCANKLKWHGVTRHRLIATEACRIAENGLGFLQRVQNEIGIELEMIDRATEAQLAVFGASPLICPDATKVLVFDIGGGSTELAWLDVSGKEPVIDAWTSIPAGVVTVAEEFGGIYVDEKVFAAMRAKIRPIMQRFAQETSNFCQSSTGPCHLLGTSGTVTTICGIHLQLPRYDRSQVDGCWLGGDDMGAVTAELLAMSHKERAASPCIGHQRADLVMAGCAIFEEIRSIWPSDRIRVADRGLREGILTSLMKEDGNYGKQT